MIACRSSVTRPAVLPPTRRGGPIPQTCERLHRFRLPTPVLLAQCYRALLVCKPSAEAFVHRGIPLKSASQGEETPSLTPGQRVGRCSRPPWQETAEVMHGRRVSTPSPAPRPG